MVQGAASYTLYNTIQPGVPPGLASHPVRRLLDPYLDPSYLQQFTAGLMLGPDLGITAPPVPVPYDWLMLFLEKFAISGTCCTRKLSVVCPGQECDQGWGCSNGTV